MKWITRERPKIDRIACPWLIKRFIDPDAEIIYVPLDKISALVKKTGAIPFDIPDVEYTHYKDQCTFDYFLRKNNLEDPALHTLARIVRAADTDRHELAPQAPGLWALFAGLSRLIPDDYALLETGMVIYDGLYQWAKYGQQEKHTQQAAEHLLIDVFEQYLAKKSSRKKIPGWVKELKEIIQDQIDTTLTLKQLSQDVNIHPAYLSREFSKYFDNLSFGDYLRKLRIEKAIGYLNVPGYTLTKIAYLTGFSDQSHFTRIFKKQTGQNPSAYRKKLKKSNPGTKS